MGVDTKLYISHRWSVKDIKDVIENRFNTEVKIEFGKDSYPEYFRLNFTAYGVDRMLHVHTDSNVAGFPAINLNFRSNEHGVMVLKTLAETFGGFFQESDTTEEFTAYAEPDYGDAKFLLDEAIKRDPELGRDKNRLAEFLKNWK